MALHLVTGYSGKAHITSADQGAFHVAMLLGGNYVLNRGNKFAANIVSNNLIEVLDGELIMQGRYARVNSGAKMEAVIENGTQDYKRNDLIVARYTKDAVTAVESIDLVVIKGTPSETEAVDPEYTEGNILDGELVADFPLYRVPLDGLNVGELIPLFEVVDNFDERLKEIIEGIVAVDNALKLGGKTAEEWQGKIDEKLDKSGGTIGSAQTVLLDLNSNTDQNPQAWLAFSHKGSRLGYIGFNRDGNPQVSKDGVNFNAILHSGNKPSGSYTGNGDTTTRIIDIGGTNEYVIIDVVQVCMILVGNGGAYCFNKSGTVSYYPPETLCTYQGKMYIRSNHTNINYSGMTYRWIAV